MSPTIIGPFVIDARDRFSDGDVIPTAVANLLNSLWLEKAAEKLRAWLTRNPSASESDFFSTAREIEASLELAIEPHEALLHAEAIAIATETILTRLAAEHLPPPPSLTVHAEALAQSSEEIQAEAKRRVTARLRATCEIARQ